jgi:phospholipid transport system substrate-binding protein
MRRDYSLRKIALEFGLLLIAACASACSYAEDIAPDVLIRSVTTEVAAAIRQDKASPTGQPARLAELLEVKILPLFNFNHMTEIAVARNWRLATPAQQSLLSAEFKTLLVRTYSTALSGYSDQVIEFKRLHAAPGDTDVTVKSVMKRPGKEALSMDYDMERLASGWKVYDIKVDGVSLISTYRETFSDQVREGGIDGLIASIAEKNRQGDDHFRFPETDSVSFDSILRGFLQRGR